MTLSELVRTGSSLRDEAGTLAHHSEVPAYGVTQEFPAALEHDVCRASVYDLNQLLADSITLCDMYRKHHWQALCPAFYPLHLLFDRHLSEQLPLVEKIIARIRRLGGNAAAMARNVAQTTLIPWVPKGREDPDTEINRLLQAHAIILEESHAMAQEAALHGDDATQDLIVSEVIRTNDRQVMLLQVYLAQDNL
jgi:starvation-inducible DNA-binding protein